MHNATAQIHLLPSGLQPISKEISTQPIQFTLCYVLIAHCLSSCTNVHTALAKFARKGDVTEQLADLHYGC